MTEFAARLQSLFSDGNLSAFSRKVGIGSTTLQGYLNGALPRLDKLVQIARATETSISWLATGEGARGTIDEQMGPRGSSVAIRPQMLASEAPMVFIPRLEVEAAAGAGAIVEHERVAEMMGFSEDWLRTRHITPSAARIVTVRGDSMEPTIRDGDLLIVDTAISEAVDNGIYVLTFNGAVLVKRLFIMRNGGLVISSDNKIAGRDEEIPPHEVPEIHIAGRVMWYGRTI